MKPVSDHIIETVDRHIETALSVLAVRERGPWKVRPSAIHKCLRAQVLSSELDPSEQIVLPLKTALAFELGTAIHQVIQSRLSLPSEEQWRSKTMTGHSDLRDPVENILIDLKTINVEGYLDVSRKGPKPEHVGQVSWYAAQAGCKHAAVVYINKNGTIPAELSKSIPMDVQTIWKRGGLVPGFNPTWQVIPIVVSSYVVEEVERRARTVLEHVELGSVPDYKEVVECRWCDVKDLCRKRLVDDAAKSNHRWRHINTKVVGTTFREGLDLSTFKEGDALELVWDKDNPHGPRREDGTAQAVKVLVPTGSDHPMAGMQVGFLPASNSPTAEIVSGHLAAGGKADAIVTELTGGGPHKNHGLNIEVRLHGSDF